MNKSIAHRLNQIRPEANKPVINLRKTFRQPTDKELAALVVAVVEHEFHKQADEATRASVFKLAAAYDEALPQHLRYERHIKTVELGESKFVDGINWWSQLSEKNRKKALTWANEYRVATIKKLKAVTELLEHQQDHMKDWDDDRMETIAKIQKQMGFEPALQ
jgi:hypothetical protein